MTESSIQSHILGLLRQQARGTWVAGGQIEDYIRSMFGAKASNASRRCRELENDGLIVSRKFQVGGKGPWCVEYRYKSLMEQLPAREKAEVMGGLF